MTIVPDNWYEPRQYAGTLAISTELLQNRKILNAWHTSKHVLQAQVIAKNIGIEKIAGIEGCRRFIQQPSRHKARDRSIVIHRRTDNQYWDVARPESIHSFQQAAVKCVYTICPECRKDHCIDRHMCDSRNILLQKPNAVGGEVCCARDRRASAKCGL